MSEGPLCPSDHHNAIYVHPLLLPPDFFVLRFMVQGEGFGLKGTGDMIYGLGVRDPKTIYVHRLLFPGSFHAFIVWGVWVRGQG